MIGSLEYPFPKSVILMIAKCMAQVGCIACYLELNCFTFHCPIGIILGAMFLIQVSEIHLPSECERPLAFSLFIALELFREL